MSRQVYTYEDFLNRMSYLFPIAANFLDNKSIQVPINEKSTIASLTKLFKNENTHNDERYGYNLWHNDPQKFVFTFLYNYWSDDPLSETNIDLQTLKALSYPAMQYIALSIINLNNRTNANGLTYDLKSVQFNSLEELTELFQYMSTLSFVDYTQTVTNVLGDVTHNINSRSNGEIDADRKAKYALKEEENRLQQEKSQNEFEQKLLEAGLTKPTMSLNQITTNLMTLTRKINEVYLRELKIRRNFAQRENELVQNQQITEYNALIADRNQQISVAHESLTELTEHLNTLKKESACRDAYDSLVWGQLGSSLSKSLENLKFDLDHIVLVDDQSQLPQLTESTNLTEVTQVTNHV